MRNKSKNMYGRMAAILLTVVLLTAGLSCTALATGNDNLIASFNKFDPGFEAALPTETTWVLTNGTAAIADGGHGGSAKSLKLPAAGDYINFYVPVEPAKNYTFSFWMKNSAEKSLQLQGGLYESGFYALRNGSPWLMANGGDADWDWKYNGYSTYLGAGTRNSSIISSDEYTFGVSRESAAAEEWRQVSINFSTPPEGVAYVRLHLACVAADEALAIDDLSLCETGFAPNRVYNGNFEALRNDGDTPALSGVTLTSNEWTTNEIVTDPQTGNTYLKVMLSEKDGNAYSYDWNIQSNSAWGVKGKQLGTRYKISFKAMTDSEPAVNRKANIQFRKSSLSHYPEINLGDFSDEWKTFTMYIDATKMAQDPRTYYNYLAGYRTDFVKRAHSAYTLYVDDVYSWYDESGIGFYEVLDFTYADAEKTDRYMDFKTGDAALENIILTESSIETASISDLPEAEDGSRKVIVRAHYLPEAAWGTDEWIATTATFSETEVTLLSAVYKHEGGKKTLVDVSIQSGTSTVNGETIDVVGEVTVPKVTGSETYTVEAMAWDMNGMKPVMEKAVLQ